MACVTVNVADAVARVLDRLCDGEYRISKSAIPFGAERHWVDGRRIRAVTVYWQDDGLPGYRRIIGVALWGTGFPTIAGSHRTVPIAELALSLVVHDKGVPGL